MKIFVDENIPYLAEVLCKCGLVIKFNGRELRNEDLIKDNCDALFVRSTSKVDEMLLNNTKVKFVGTATSGTDHIDIDYLKLNNISFVSAGGSNANSVAELVVYSILKWSMTKNIKLDSKCIGIIGFGNIGKIVANYANSLGIKVLINDPPLKDINYKFPDYIEYCEIEDLMQRANIITNHVPLTSAGKYATFKLINKTLINSIPSNSLFIHASRGKIVDEKALIERIKDGRITAVIDVWENEPLINTELARLTMIAMPHVAGYSRDGKLKGALMMVRQFEKYLGTQIDTELIENELNSGKTDTGNLIFQDSMNLLEKLKYNRDFEYDHNKLLSSLEKIENERAKEFDKMRKQYPVRRETLIPK